MGYRVPLFELNYDEAEEAAVADVIHSKWLSMGAKTAVLEEEFSRLLGCRHSVAVSNCTAALHLSLCAIGIGPGDEVISPSLTFVATVNAIRYVGAEPVFCDVVGAENLNLNPRHLESLVGPRTRAIMVMHYGGFPCDMDAVLSTARRHNLAVIEDACHGPLSEYRSRKLGTLGLVGCFSFFANKNISTAEGGMVVTADDQLSQRIRLLRSHGMTTASYDRARGHATSYDVVELGYNYRMDDIRASLGIVQLAKLPQDLAARRQVRAVYLEALRDVREIVVPFASHDGPVSNYIFPVVLREGGQERREQIRDRIHEHGVQTSVHYPAVHRFKIYSGIGASLPETERLSDTEITLPIHGRMSSADVEFVVGALKEALSRG